MNQQDKLFEAFRKQQHQLEEMPSPQTWNRLQQRLDSRKKRRTSPSIYRLFAMVAAVIGLALIATSVFHLANPINKQAFKTQELPNYSPEILQKAIQAAAYRSSHQLALGQTIQEGNPSKLLLNRDATTPILVPKKKTGI